MWTSVGEVWIGLPVHPQAHICFTPPTPTTLRVRMQVDASKMEAFIDHFVTSIGLSEQYTMLVINPTWSVSEPKYGYRQGVSQKELDHIALLGVDSIRSLLVSVQGCGGVSRCTGTGSVRAGRSWSTLRCLEWIRYARCW